MFWAIAVLLLAVAAGVTLSPLLTQVSRWKLAAWAGIIVLPLTATVLYLSVGTPAALDAAATQAAPPGDAGAEPDMVALTEQLRKRLEDKPESVEGWVLLGRSYKTLQQYPQAVEALETAERLQPGDPLIMTELVEARLFASGDSRISPEMIRQLEQAVEADPSLQKALWLLGIAAAQSGDNPGAIQWWERLLQQLEPGSEVAQTLVAQIEEARGQVGEVSEPAATSGGQGANIDVELSAAASSALSEMPAGAVLFIIVRAADLTGGPPLGVRRVNQPKFPLSLTLSDGDSMMPERPISSAAKLSLQARLSLSGQAAPAPGDWQSSVVSLAPDQAEPASLILAEEIE